MALAIILVLLSTGVPYGIYKSGGIKKTMPPELPTWIHREHRDKKVETLFGTPETAAQDEEMKVTNQETKLEEGSDSTAPVIKSKEDTTLDTVGPKDMGLPLKGESAKGIVLLRKGEEKEADAITDIESHMEGDILKIILTGNGAITKYKAFSLDDPTRLVIDVFEIAKTVPQRLIKINSPYVDRIRIGTHPDKVRLCLDSSMEELPSYHILRNENRLVIVISEIQKSETRELAPGKREGKVRIP